MNWLVDHLKEKRSRIFKYGFLIIILAFIIFNHFKVSPQFAKGEKQTEFLRNIDMIAIVLTIIYPGLGQFYYGKNIRASFMVILGLTPLYPAVFIWSLIDIIVLNKRGAIPEYTSRDAAWAFLILVVIVPALIGITFSGLYAIGSWYSNKYVFPEQTMTEGRQICSAIIEYNQIHGKYPNSIIELTKSNPIRAGWQTDSWKELYIYEVDDSKGFRLISKGRDKILGSEDDLIFN